jgi:hypothetical protein
MGRHAARRGLVPALLGIAILAGCGKDRGSEVAVGCWTEGDVPPAVRAEIQAASDSVFARLARGAWDEVYTGTASKVQSKGDREAFLNPLQRALAQIGFPEERETVSLSVVRFGAEFPPTSPVPCAVEGKEDPRRLLLDSYPTQASLVQRATLGNEKFYFSTLWHLEEGTWRLAAFFAKPATFQGKDWQEYAEEAAGERLAERMRNSALLYNLAIDLVLPNGWTQPSDLRDLQRKQGRLRVSAVPTGTPEAWPAAADTFHVFSLTYGVGRQRPGLVVRHLATASLGDTTAQRRKADHLFSYMESNFPEYEEVFDLVTLVAVDSTSGEVWFKAYPLGESP